MDQNPVLKCSDPKCALEVVGNANDTCPCGNGTLFAEAPFDGEKTMFVPSSPPPATDAVTSSPLAASLEDLFALPPANDEATGPDVAAPEPEPKPADADPFALPPLQARDVVTGLPPVTDELPEKPARKSHHGLAFASVAIVVVATALAFVVTRGDGESEEVASNPFAPSPAKVETPATAEVTFTCTYTASADQATCTGKGIKSISFAFLPQGEQSKDPTAPWKGRFTATTTDGQVLTSDIVGIVDGQDASLGQIAFAAVE